MSSEAVRGAGDRLAAALVELGRWSLGVHPGDPRHLSVRLDDQPGDTLLRVSEGLGDQEVAARFVAVVAEVISAHGAPGSWMRLGDDELWMLYDLVAARVALYDASELVAMENLGGEPWRLLARRFRAVLPPAKSVPA